MANSLIIEDIKTKVLKEFVNNQELVDALDCPSSDKKGWKPIHLINTPSTVEKGFTPLLFNYHKNPEYIKESISFINLMVHTSRKTSTYIDAELEVYIYTHNDRMRINNPQIVSNRNDYISRLIDKQLNGTDIGFGSLTLISNNEGVFNKDFNYRKMVFVTSDINDSLCD